MRGLASGCGGAATMPRSRHFLLRRRRVRYGTRLAVRFLGRSNSRGRNKNGRQQRYRNKQYSRGDQRTLHEDPKLHSKWRSCRQSLFATASTTINTHKSRRARSRRSLGEGLSGACPSYIAFTTYHTKQLLGWCQMWFLVRRWPHSKRRCRRFTLGNAQHVCGNTLFFRELRALTKLHASACVLV